MSAQRSTREIAEARFAGKLLRDQEARRAISEYEADNIRIAERTARLRALRLAKEAAEAGAETETPATRSPARRKRRER